MMYGLRTWWVGAVGTTLLRLHIDPAALLIGAAGAMVAAIVSIAITVRGLQASDTAGAARPARLTDPAHDGSGGLEALRVRSAASCSPLR